MEENKTSKEIKMSTATASPENEKKLSYEELNKVCAEMSQQLQQQSKYIQQLHQRMQEVNLMLQTKRMDYLLKAVELSVNYHKDSYYPCFASSFIEKCIAEIQEALTIKEEDKEEQ